MLQKRKMERVIVQRESNQILEPNVDETICESVMTMDDNAVNKFKLNKSGFRSFFRSQNDNRWNDLNFTSKKHARLMIPEGMI